MMPTFEPVGIFYTQEQFSRTDGRSSVIWTYRHKPWGEQLFTESQLQQAYEAGKRDAVAEWLPIETAPKSLNSILLLGNEKVADGYWGERCNKGKGAWVWPYVRTEPTHWMPLPVAPKGEKE